MAEGTYLIAQERLRQVMAEGWTAAHDDDHFGGSLAIAAACYATHGTGVSVVDHGGADAWPWEGKWDKREKHDRIRQLVIAGALIAAEIDRLQRLQAAGVAREGGRG